MAAGIWKLYTAQLASRPICKQSVLIMICTLHCFAGIWKLYTAELATPLTGKDAAAAVRRFGSGSMQLVGDRSPLLPAGLLMLDDTTAEVAICEGRYHQVGGPPRVCALCTLFLATEHMRESL
jgi:hypothetical protein